MSDLPKMGTNGTAYRREDGFWIVFSENASQPYFVGATPQEAGLRAEIARLKALIEGADHAPDCAKLKWWFGDGVLIEDQRARLKQYDGIVCDCWKSRALRAGGEGGRT